jgi:hypothetical protein
MSAPSAIADSTDPEARYRLYSGELVALTHMVHAIAKTLAQDSDARRQFLLDELQARLETLQQVHDLGNCDGETREALAPLALLITELS